MILCKMFSDIGGNENKSRWKYINHGRRPFIIQNIKSDSFTFKNFLIFLKRMFSDIRLYIYIIIGLSVGVTVIIDCRFM